MLVALVTLKVFVAPALLELLVEPALINSYQPDGSYMSRMYIELA